MINRNGDTLTYDVENRLIQVSAAGGITTTTFLYDGDGNRVQKVVTINGVMTTTSYMGNYYEVTEEAATKYYYFGSQRVAMRDASGVTYLHADQLGSTSVTTDESGTVVNTQTYLAFGAVRSSEGASPTDYSYTGQKADASLNGIMFYGARYYDPQLGRFLQADTIVPNPDNPQSLNRYSYTLNNPLRYNDPTGHMESCPQNDCGGNSAGPPPPGYDPLTGVVVNPTPEVPTTGTEAGPDSGGCFGDSNDHSCEHEKPTDEKAKLLPNLLVIGGVVSVGVGPAQGQAYEQVVIDFKHHQIGSFWGGGLGLSFGATPISGSVGVEMGMGYCLENCTNLLDFGSFGGDFGASAYAPLGAGIDYNFSMDGPSFWPNGKMQYMSITGGGGVDADIHVMATYSVPQGIEEHPLTSDFARTIYQDVYQATNGNSVQAAYFAYYSTLIPYEPPH